jgi:hypothetical protein
MAKLTNSVNDVRSGRVKSAKDAICFPPAVSNCCLVLLLPTHLVRLGYESRGYNFDEIADAVAMAIREQLGPRPINVIAHDW